MIRTPTPSELGSKRREKTCRGGGTKPSDKGSLTPTSYLLEEARKILFPYLNGDDSQARMLAAKLWRLFRKGGNP